MKTRHHYITPENPFWKKQSYQLTFLALLLGLLIICILCLASVPPVSRDALTHHLFVPKLYIEYGNIYEIPEISFSYYPMNLDLLYMFPLYLGNDIIPKYIHFFFAILTACLIYTHLKKRLSPIYGLLGALFFLSIPIIIKLSITVYVDLGLMFFTTASILLLFRWMESNYQLQYLIFAGVYCGLAAGTKYNGLITFFLLPLFIPILYIRSRNTDNTNIKSVCFALLFLLTALVTFSPWLIRNYLWTGNPVYPLYDSLIQDSVKRKSDAHVQQLIKDNPSHYSSNVFVNRKIIYGETWWQTILLPIRFFFEGQDNSPRHFDGKLTPFLLLLPFFAFLKQTPNKYEQIEKSFLLGFALLFFFFTFFQQVLRIRYIVSIIPALVILSTYGLHNIHRTLSKFHEYFPIRNACKRLLATFLFLAIFAYNGRYITEQFRTVRPFSYIAGDIDREHYITQFRPEHPAIQYANTLLLPKTKVLCLFLGNRGYYMNFTPVFSQPIEARVKTIKAILKQEGITHILLRDDLTWQWIQRLEMKERQQTLSFFQDNTQHLFRSGGYSFVKVNDVLQ